MSPKKIHSETEVVNMIRLSSTVDEDFIKEHEDKLLEIRLKDFILSFEK